ncbi:MAG: flagellar basal body rod protein FlgC [Alphaproteobacteria bacterium]|nr:flagellar basal body rod protein FlgC [Alphaproteobacteria bacterium]
MFGFSTLQKILHVAFSGMQAQKERLLVVAQNLANAGTRAPSPGMNPYQRKTVSFGTELDRKRGIEVVKVKKVGRDSTPFPVIYSPGDPGADEKGYVLETNVKSPVEMTDAMEAKRGYESSLKAYEKALSMQQDAISLLRGKA